MCSCDCFFSRLIGRSFCDLRNTMVVCWPSFNGPTWWQLSSSYCTSSSPNPRLWVRACFTFSVICFSFSSSFKLMSWTRIHAWCWYWCKLSNLIDNFVLTFCMILSLYLSALTVFSKFAIRGSSSFTLMLLWLFEFSFGFFWLSGVFVGAFFWCSLIWHVLALNFWIVFCFHVLVLSF